MAEGKFVTAINCMDGRVQKPVFEWMTEKYNADYCDMITEAGADGCLVKGEGLSSIKHRIGISVEGHGSKVVALVGHHDCAGHPVSKEEHIRDIKKDIETIKGWGFDAEIIGLWVGPDWKVELVDI